MVHVLMHTLCICDWALDVGELVDTTHSVPHAFACDEHACVMRVRSMHGHLYLYYYVCVRPTCLPRKSRLGLRATRVYEHRSPAHRTRRQSRHWIVKVQRFTVGCSHATHVLTVE